MNCKKCGALLVEGDQFCKSCGTPVTESYAPSQQNAGVNVSNQNEGTNTPTGMFNQNINNSVNQGNMQPDNNVGVQPNPINTQPNNNVEYQSNLYNPGWATNNNSQFESNQQSNQGNNNIIKYIVIGVVAFAILIAIIFGIRSIFNTFKQGESGSQAVTQNTYDVVYNQFKLKIPNNQIYEINNDMLYLTNEEQTWTAMLYINEGSFDKLKDNKNELKQSLQENGYLISNEAMKKINNTEFIIMEASSEGINGIVAFSEANPSYFVMLTMVDNNNEFNYSIIEKIEPIISSMTYVGTSNSIKSNINIDFSGVSDLAQ